MLLLPCLLESWGVAGHPAPPGGLSLQIAASWRCPEWEAPWSCHEDASPDVWPDVGPDQPCLCVVSQVVRLTKQSAAELHDAIEDTPALVLDCDSCDLRSNPDARRDYADKVQTYFNWIQQSKDAARLGPPLLHMPLPALYV